LILNFPLTFVLDYALNHPSVPRSRSLRFPSRSYPATPLLLSRARFCISAGHTREDMDFALEQIEAVADLCHIRYRKYING
jgi:hypothetical protein